MSLLTGTAGRAIYDIITTTRGAVEVLPVKQSRVYNLALSQNCEKRLLASSCPSVRMKQLGSHWMDVHEI
jgi:hypothetical protein